MDVRKLKRIKEKILSVLRGGDILILVPPFGSSEDIALGPQLLQVLAEQNGCKTDVLYLNILLASITGSESYKHIYRAPEEWMLAERLFARSAYGLAPLGKNGRRRKAYPPGDDNRQRQFDPGMYLQTERVCRAFLEEAAAVIAPLEYKIVGCTTAMTRQTNCSISLLARIKKESPETITIIGGSGCRGELAEGIASLSDHIDYIFPGESERAFPNFLQRWREKKLPPQRHAPFLSAGAAAETPRTRGLPPPGLPGQGRPRSERSNHPEESKGKCCITWNRNLYREFVKLNEQRHLRQAKPVVFAKCRLCGHILRLVPALGIPRRSNPGL
jgi:hypothetical protein